MVDERISTAEMDDLLARVGEVPTAYRHHARRLLPLAPQGLGKPRWTGLKWYLLARDGEPPAATLVESSSCIAREALADEAGAPAASVCSIAPVTFSKQRCLRAALRAGILPNGKNDDRGVGGQGRGRRWRSTSERTRRQRRSGQRR